MVELRLAGAPARRDRLSEVVLERQKIAQRFDESGVELDDALQLIRNALPSGAAGRAEPVRALLHVEGASEDHRVGLANAYSKLWRQGSLYERLLALLRTRILTPVAKPLKRMRRLTPEKAAELVARYLEGEEITALLTCFGIDRVSVYKALENASVPRRKRCITAGQREQAVALYAEGLSVTKIAAQLRCSYHGLYGAMKRAGVEFRDRHWRGSQA